MIHAIGDRAIRMALDAFERAAAANPLPARGRRHRIEHIETIDSGRHSTFRPPGSDCVDAAISRAARPGANRSVAQPTSARIALRAPGRTAASRDTRVRLAFGSDWPVVAIDPLLGLHVAVNRTTLRRRAAEGGWIPSERLTIAQAVDAYTRGAAWASFDEHRKGSTRARHAR